MLMLLQQRRHQFVNEEYVPLPPAALGPIRIAGVSGDVRQRREWHTAGVLCIRHSPRQLSVWREYICSWELALDALFSSVRACTCFRSPMGCAYCRADASRSIQRAGRSSRSVLPSGPVGNTPRSIASGNSGTHGGLTRGFGFGPRSGASHCAVCSA